MPRLLAPSPNEEAYYMEQHTQKKKKERLIAARKQSIDWSRKSVNDKIKRDHQKELVSTLQKTKIKMSSLSEKENEIKEELASALNSVGEAFDDANKENAAERDKKREELLEQYKVTAAKRHRAALAQLNKAKEKQRLEENRLIELRKITRTSENTRSKKVLEQPPDHSQPLIQVPSRRPVSKPALGGLDAFTKTYYHLPVHGIGVVDEKSLSGTGAKDAKTLAAEVEAIMLDFRAKLAESKQAREERADVRGNAALQKVQLKNVLEDVTSQLDRVAVFNRTRKQPYGVRSNVFASNSARENTQKQRQVELEHAVEDIFDKNVNVEMVLPRSVKFENVEDAVTSLSCVEKSGETVDDESLHSQSLPESNEKDKTLLTNPGAVPTVNRIDEAPHDDTKVDDTRADDMRAEESRPSLSLYFPLHSDISSEPERGETIVEASDFIEALNTTEDQVPGYMTDQDVGDVVDDADDENNDGETTCETVQETWGPVTPVMESSRASSASSCVSKQNISTSSTVVLKEANAHGIDLSALIKEQLKINKELRILAKPLNTSSEESDRSLHQPPPISFTKPSVASTPSTAMSFQEIVQELLSSSQASSGKSAEMSQVSESISQHTLSQNSSVNSTKTPTALRQQILNSDSEVSSLRVSDVSSVHSKDNSVRQGNAGSVASDLSVLQSQLKRINTHLSEIGKIKDQDDLYYRL